MIDLDAISDYAWRMERTGSSPCYIETKHIRAMVAELKAARKVVEAARKLKWCNNMYLDGDGHERLEKAIKELEGGEK